MNGQLEAIVSDLMSAHRGLRALYDALPTDAWSQRPGPGRWSPAECVAHLNLTSEAILPLLRAGLQEARAIGGLATTRFRRDAIGWLVWQAMRPSGGLRTATTPAFVPSADRSTTSLMADFDRLQAALVECAREADGLPIDRVRLVSPFDARVKCNLYAALTLVPRHQHRHVLQAERAACVSAPFAVPVPV